MSKVLETIVLVAATVAVAVFAPEFLPQMSMLDLAFTANVLLGPSTPKGLATGVNNQLQRLSVSMDTTTARKIAAGITAGATDLRYQAYTGTNQRYYEQIIAVASHQVNSIYEVWFDNEKAWTSAGGVQGRYVGFLTVDAINLGTSSNGIAIDSNWTTSCTLTGCAYIHMKFDLLGTATDGSNNSPFASGVTTRVTIRTKAALVYDPRLDSTVAGGSGSQRAATQSTWAWDDNASRNPALQLLFYLLGWQINGKLAVGMGLPSARIDLASFAVAANACDESITLNGGGTEPRYRSDGVITESDDRQSVIETLCANMNAVLRDAGGKLSLTVLHNDLATPIASFTEGSILGEEQWQQTPDLSSTFNVCRGRRVDPSDNALYQLTDTPQVSITSNDGIDRIDTMDMPFCQSNGQAQRIIKQRLQRKQYQGKYTLTGNASWWQVSLGNIVQLSHAGLGWTNKLFRVAGQGISKTGATKITLIEENAAIYAWSNSESAAVTPGAPTVYNPANSPLVAGMNVAGATSVVINPVNDVLVHADPTGAIPGANLPVIVPITASLGTFSISTLGTWSVTTTTGVTCTIGAATGILNISALAVTEAFIPVSFTYRGVTRTATIHVVVQNDPTTSSTGGTSSGGVSSTNTLGNTTGTPYDTTNAVSATLTCAAGSTGQVAVAAPVGYKSVDGVSVVTTYGKWQWRVVGGTFADIATEVAASATNSFSTLDDGSSFESVGRLSVNQTKTGLTNGTNYEFRFLWRDDGHRARRTGGTLTATGS